MTADRRLIEEPEGAQQFAAVRATYMAICNGDAAAAAILNQIEFWTNSRLPADAVDRRAALSAAGDIWVKGDQPSLAAALWGVFKSHDLKRGLKLLTDLGYLEKQRDPGNRFKAALHYRFIVDTVQAAVDFWAGFYHQSPVTTRSVTGDQSSSHQQPHDQSQVTNRVVTHDQSSGQGQPHDQSQVTPRMVTGDHELKSLKTQSLSQNPLENSGGEDARTREQPSSPVFHPLIQAFLDAHPDGLRPKPGRDWDELALDLVDTLGAQPDEVGALVRDKWRNPKRTFYRFDMLLSDLSEWRGQQLRLVTREEYSAPAGDESVGPASDAEADAWIAERVAPPAHESAPAGVIPEAAAKAWDAAYQQFELQDEINFKTHMRGAALIAYESDGPVFVVTVHNASARDMLKFRLYRTIKRILSDCYGQNAEIEFQVAAPPAATGMKTIGDAKWMRELTASRAKETV